MVYIVNVILAMMEMVLTVQVSKFHNLTESFCIRVFQLYFSLQSLVNSCNGVMCHVNATCLNSTEDGMHCECNTGFDGDGINCTSKQILIT